MPDFARREALKARVAAKKDAVAALRDRLDDASFQRRAQLAWDLFDDVDTQYLADARPDRAIGDEKLWLNAAEMSFQVALQILRDLEIAVETRGRARKPV